MNTRCKLCVGMFLIGASLLCQPASAASTERVSVGYEYGEIQGDRASDTPSISAHGRYVAFASDASNLVDHDSNNVADIFVHDRVFGTRRVSVSSAGIQGNRASNQPSISADGRFVAFTSSANNLVPNDTNELTDVFVHDRQTGVTKRVSLADDESQLENASREPSISGDGRYVAFVLEDSDFDDLVYDGYLLLRDRLSGTTSKIGNADFNKNPSISADGGTIAWACWANADIGNFEICVQDLPSGEVQTLSLPRGSGQAAKIGDHGPSFDPSISANGRFVAFASEFDGFDGNPNNTTDIFLLDRLALGGPNWSAYRRISKGPSGEQVYGGDSLSPSISADGRFVAFSSKAFDVVANDTNSAADIFVWSAIDDSIQRISVDNAGHEVNDGNSLVPSISAVGLVAFASNSPSLVTGDTNEVKDVFVRDRGALVSIQSDLLVDFGANGLWQYMNDRRWVKIDDASPSVVATGDIDGSLRDEAIAGFPGRGLLARYNNAGPWQKLRNQVPTRVVSGDFDGNGIDDLAGDFNGEGISVRVNNGNWSTVRNVTSSGLKVGDLDGNGQTDLIANLGSDGLWVRYNNSTWVKISAIAPVRAATGDLDGNGQDEVIGDFGDGLRVRYNNADPWGEVREGSTEGIATGDLDGDGEDVLLADLGSGGLRAYYNNTGPWVKLDNRSPVTMLAADLDGSGQSYRGQEDLVVNFGSGGLRVRYNNSGAFEQINAWTSQAITAGGFD